MAAPPPSVMVVTSYPPSWEKFAEITTATHRKYCEAHGYDYFADCSSIKAQVRSPWVDECEGRTGKYAGLRTMIKFPLLAHFMDKESCGKEYDYVCWFDADMIVSRFDLPLTTWLNTSAQEGEGDLVLAADVNGLHPTVIWLRNTTLTRGLVWANANAGQTMFMQHMWNDIMSLRFFLATPPYSHIVRYFSAKELCAMPPGVYPIPADVRAQYEWTPESFSLHLSALSLEKRIEFATAFVKERGL